jgi:hypothetical protein
MTDNELLEIFRARDWGRTVAATANDHNLAPFHAGCAILQEGIALMFGVGIETARTTSMEVIGMLVERVKAANAQASGLAAHASVAPGHPDSPANDLTSQRGNLASCESSTQSNVLPFAPNDGGPA